MTWLYPRSAHADDWTAIFDGRPFSIPLAFVYFPEEAIGSSPAFVSVGAAADEAKNAIRALPASACLAFVVVPAENIVIFCTSAGSGPTRSAPGIGKSSLICWKPSSASPRATTLFAVRQPHRFGRNYFGFGFHFAATPRRLKSSVPT